MDDFAIKKINNEEKLGNKLADNRRNKNLNLEEISRRLGIKTDYLKAIENDRFDLLPSGIYGKNFLKRYASFLNYNGDLLEKGLANLEQENKNDPFAKKALDKKSLRLFPKMLRNIILVIAIVICFLYLAFYARKIVSPPELSIIYPADNLLTKEKTIKIEGETEEEAELRINGELILNNNSGSFFQEINLKNGLNSITISAKKKYSKENIIIRQIIVE
jgi:transcriptional regulator with XRE-family HTH domain